MALVAETWPIAASLLPFVDGLPRGIARDDEAESRWDRVFGTVTEAGFDVIDLTDTWLPFGDLSPGHRDGMRERMHENGLTAASLSVIRRSVTDERSGRRTSPTATGASIWPPSGVWASSRSGCIAR